MLCGREHTQVNLCAPTLLTYCKPPRALKFYFPQGVTKRTVFLQGSVCTWLVCWCRCCFCCSLLNIFLIALNWNQSTLHGNMYWDFYQLPTVPQTNNIITIYQPNSKLIRMALFDHRMGLCLCLCVCACLCVYFSIRCLFAADLL